MALHHYYSKSNFQKKILCKGTTKKIFKTDTLPICRELCWSCTEEVGIPHVSDHAPRFSNDVSMERMCRLSFCKNYEVLHPGVGSSGKNR